MFNSTGHAVTRVWPSRLLGAALALSACGGGEGEGGNDTPAPAVVARPGSGFDAAPPPAEDLTNAPVDNIGAIVTPERHLLCYGAGGDGKRIDWCDSENNTVWTPTATNSAGSLTLQSDGRIVTARRVRGQTAENDVGGARPAPAGPTPKRWPTGSPAPACRSRRSPAA